MGVEVAAVAICVLTVVFFLLRERRVRRAAEGREAELRILNERLGEMANQSALLAEETDRVGVLQRVDEQRSALLRSVSHDLRTPLATIRAVATDLRDGSYASDPETAHALLDTVCDEAERLDRLVGNLLSLSRIEAGALSPERQAVDIEELVTDRLRRLRRLLRQVRIQTEFDEGLPLIDGDYTQLEQVFTNLLENASRHAPPASTLRVGARRIPARGGGGEQVEVWVADEGIGIPEHEIERIFEPFRQAEGRGSSGIGLAICKAVAEAHNGAIRVDRTPGGGATFRVTLPARLNLRRDRQG